MHAHSFAPLLISLCVILFAAKLGGHIAIRLKLPPVLGELLFGMLLGNLSLVGFHYLDGLVGLPALDILAELGVILLLFHVGLESTVGEMVKVGVSSSLVAVLGVVAPFFLGWGVSAWLLPEQSVYVHIFIAATLTATSVGITARVFSDLKQTKSMEAKIVLGAAVIDDVLGLIILSVVTGVIAAANEGSAFTVSTIAVVTAKAFAFLIGAIFLGQTFSKQLFRFGAKLRGNGVLIGFALFVCFLFSYIATLVGLAPIVGAFAAGLVLEPAHFKGFQEKRELENLLQPILAFLVPVFFVLMGLRVDLTTFADPSILGLALLLTLVAIIGKQVCSLGVTKKGVNRLAVGVGMVPRGEVGLIFANIGLTLFINGEQVISPAIFSAVVFMVVVTTLIAPPLLSYLLTQKK